MVLAKDFIETAEGLVFAVVENGLEQDKVLCFLRYVTVDRQWKKVNTEQANQFLADKYPHYLYYSPHKQAHCHAVVCKAIFKHHKPREKLQSILVDKRINAVEMDLIKLCHLYEKNGLNLNNIGVTGSILISAQQQSSDIDLVFYCRDDFNQARKITQKLISQGDCSELNADDWLASFDRRSCELGYSEYLWHEKRKFNKAVINHRKFDLTLVSEAIQQTTVINYEKQGAVLLKVQVVDDTLAYDYPAEFGIKYQQIQSIVSYTATYTGQAKNGEWVEVAGQLEYASDGTKRIVVGSSREAQGEYIKVINDKIE